jgi:1,4-alpha-glucan branching enzyme
MFLAGEEFGDVHDQSNSNVNLKQEDPVQWLRAALPANAALAASVAALVRLRTSHPALGRNEVSFFYFHPRFDDNGAPRVFAYCRTAGLPLGSAGQAIVIANMGPAAYATYDIPGWPWQGMALTEYGYTAPAPVWNASEKTLSLRLNAFAARVFTT